ncbi:MAG: hypothetical protein ACRECO_14435 [Xanthobacteraceae bacterium]
MSNRIVNLAAGIAALAALPLSFTAVGADSVRTFSCVRAGGAVSCTATRRNGSFNPHIRTVEPPVSDEDRAKAEARDRRWVERCRPIIRQDELGVPRYAYAAQGCEFGRLD